MRDAMECGDLSPLSNRANKWKQATALQSKQNACIETVISTHNNETRPRFPPGTIVTIGVGSTVTVGVGQPSPHLCHQDIHMVLE